MTLMVILGIASSAYLVQPETSIAQTVVDKEVIDQAPCKSGETNKDCVQRLVNIYAKQYGVSAGAMMRTLTNENRTFQFDIQSGIKYKAGNRWKQPAGSYEKSYGIAQIHLPDNPEVTREQAIDPAFAVEFMAKKFAEGRQRMWMGYEG